MNFKALVIMGVSFLSFNWIGCGVKDGPSLLGSASSPPFIHLKSGQAASVVLGQADFVTPNAYDATRVNMSGMYGQAIVPTSTGGLLIMDQSNNRILGYSTVPTNPYPNPADFVVGQSSWTASGGSAGQFNGVGAGYYDTLSGKFLATDYGNKRILIFNGGTPSASSPGAPFVTSTPDVAIGASSVTVAGTPLSAGTCDSTHTRGPYDIVVANGKVLMVDFADNRVLIYNSIPTTNNAAANLVLGQSALSGSCSAAVAANRLDGPTAIWTDGVRIAIADSSNNRVLIWSSWPTTSGQPADIVLGQPSMTTNVSNNTPGNPGVASEFSLSLPYGVASNGTQLFVADEVNNRVLVWNSWPTQNQQAADIVLGQNDFVSTSNPSPPNANSMYNPYGVKMVGNQLIVNDGENGRILIYE